MSAPEEAATPLAPPLDVAPTHRSILGALAARLRLVGTAELVLSAELLALALSGYRTPRAVNPTLLVAGLVLLTLSGWTLAAGRSLRAVVRSEGRDGAHLIEALEGMTKIHGYLGVVLAIAGLIVGSEVVAFFGKILGRT